MKQWVVLALMVLAAAFSRLIPHPWNFTAVGAMALFAGAYFSAKKYSLIVPLAAIPFFGNQIYGDLFFSAILFGSYETLKNIVPELVPSKQV